MINQMQNTYIVVVFRCFSYFEIKTYEWPDFTCFDLFHFNCCQIVRFLLAYLFLIHY